MTDGEVTLPGSGWQVYEIGPGTAKARVTNRRGLRLHHPQLRVSMATTTDGDELRVGVGSVAVSGWAVAAGERGLDGSLPTVLFLSLHRGDAGRTVEAIAVGDRCWAAEVPDLQFDVAIATSGGVSAGKSIKERSSDQRG